LDTALIEIQSLPCCDLKKPLLSDRAAFLKGIYAIPHAEGVKNKCLTEGNFIEVKVIMKRLRKVLYYVSLSISLLVGLWHFFVPHLFRWYDYIPMQFESLIVGIDYTNYCFSALLFGSSFVLILLGKSALSLNRESIIFYTFLTVVWVFRACLAAFIEPWPLEPIPAAAIGQLIGSIFLASIMVYVSVSLWRASCNRKPSD